MSKINISKPSLFIGIDPGKSGGIVVLGLDHVEDAIKMPATPKDTLDVFNEYDSNKEKIMCMVEEVGSMPGNGVKALFTFGYGTGVLHTSLIANKIPFVLVKPKKWMAYYGLAKRSKESGTAWKNRLKSRAQMLFPDESVVLWNADAFLLAYYCRYVHGGISSGEV